MIPSNTSMRAQFVRWVKVGTAYRGACLQVFIDLAERANDKGLCWVTNETVAEDTRCSVRSVQYSTTRLAQDGWIQIRRQRGPRGENIYRIDLQKLEKSWRVGQDLRKQQKQARWEARNRFLAHTPPTIAEITPPAPHETCGKQVENLAKPVENQRISGESGTLRVQTATSRGAKTAQQGCKPLHPNPLKKANTTTNTKAYYYEPGSMQNGPTRARASPVPRHLPET